jgi:hypothetical protein
MKMVKSLLLGSAAGLVAMAGAQAADLSVKAKPVQYVKICSLYGVGFYYIPGTDMCIKIGGWVRAEYGWGQNGNFAWGWANANRNDRTTNNSDFRARGYITADARNQTPYGTVRGYIAVGLSENDVGFNTASNTFSANRAFIQWAGFTFGRAQSFFDFYSVPATSYWGAFPASDTGDGGWFVMAYTAQFGNGFSATISAEQHRTTNIFGPTTAGGTVNFAAAFPGNTAGFEVPDVVGNLRVDQAWGSAQVMAAYHDVQATYYNGSTVDAYGHPEDKAGFAVGVGLKLNAPMIAKGDYLQTQFTYAQGASRYVFATPNSNWTSVDGNTIGLGLLSDAVYGGNVVLANGTSLELTTAWNVNAAYEHFWNAQWKTSVYGGYAEVLYNERANAMLCSAFGGGNGAGVGTNATVVAGCNNDWNTWWVGTRTQWNVTPDFYMGLDVLYQKLNSLSTVSGATPLTIANSSCQAGCRLTDDDNWSVRFRVHKDFYP